MGSFQDEIQQIRQEREAQIKIDAWDMERRRQECEPYIEHICDSIRCGIKREAVNGDVAYRVYRKYSIGDDDEADELLVERQEEPHYVIIWSAQCILDVTKNNFVYVPDKLEFRINETNTLFYLLGEVEKRLEENDIFPVKIIETEKRCGFLRPYLEYRCRDQKVSLLDLDACHELEKAFEKGKTGIGGRPSFEVIGSRFAYFIPE